MANYTENYDLVKPTMAETADIRTINGNMDTVDTIMHDTQVSMADAFDSTASYAIRDLVMYEFKLYQCIHPHEGPWDADNWVRVNAAETGGNYVEITPTYNSGLKIAETNIDGDQDEIKVPYFGGATSQADGAGGAVPAPTSSDVGKFLSSNGGWETPSGGGGGTTVVPNPVGEPTDELGTVQIGNTIFSIPGSGGGAGDFIDEVIYEDTTGATGAQNITLSERLDNYDAIYFEFYFPSESTYLSANPSPLQRVVEAPTGASNKYLFQTYPSYGNRYILLTSSDGGTSATLTTSAWGEAIYPSVYRIHGIKFGGLYTEDIAKGDWTQLISTVGGAWSSATAIPDGTTHIAIVLEYQSANYVPIIFKLSDMDKLADETGNSHVENGFSWKVGSNYDDIAWDYDSTNKTLSVYAGYSGITIKAYAIKTAQIELGGHVYDSNEKLVGEWFGEPLYEKTVVIKENGTDNYTYSSEVYQNCLPVADFINITQMYAARGDTVGYVDVTSNQNEVYYVPNKNGNLYFKSSHSPTDIIVTVQYTKPTV